MTRRQTRSRPSCSSTIADGIATVTLNRPGQFNALSSALIDELQSAFDRIAADPGVRVVVLAASGRGFCAGHDLKEIRAMAGVAEVESLFARCSRMMLTITRCRSRSSRRCTASRPRPAVSWSRPAISRSPPSPRPLRPPASTSARSAPRRALRWAGRSAASTPWRCCSPVRRSTLRVRTRSGSSIASCRPEALDAEVSAMARLIAARSPPARSRPGKEVFYRQLELPLDEAYAVAGHAIACDFSDDSTCRVAIVALTVVALPGNRAHGRAPLDAGRADAGQAHRHRGSPPPTRPAWRSSSLKP